jgi:hypothetical protein
MGGGGGAGVILAVADEPQIPQKHTKLDKIRGGGGVPRQQHVLEKEGRETCFRFLGFQTAFTGLAYKN